MGTQYKSGRRGGKVYELYVLGNGGVIKDGTADLCQSVYESDLSLTFWWWMAIALPLSG